MADPAERPSRSLRDHRTLATTAAAADPSPEQVLAALALLDGVRADLDRIERVLIGSAREQRTSWARIAAALGLASRQAAEQRWLRLRAEGGRDPVQVRNTPQRQRTIDNAYGVAIRRLRTATVNAYRQLDADPDWDARHPRAALARTSVEAARTAPPGALFALVIEAMADLDAMTATPPPQPLPQPLRTALDRLRRAVDAARPVPGG
ncbi:hypothetical protein OG792_27300 [Micromonospora sp. NBC_01699]|uniref:hypothetical protein n=1 Tax=Micromonospora sp. NBC_01699 TaxID=2975984 RepID=UPI002E2E62F8|nr:hypothetical protein [Micromonospora sp. NBC_01699]